jgi:HNH endonuclease
MLLVALPLFSPTVWQYIETYTQHHSRDSARDDVVREIDNVRNGTLLNPVAHRQFGNRIAFLMVHNALMLLKRSLMALISRHLTLP